MGLSYSKLGTIQNDYSKMISGKSLGERQWKLNQIVSELSTKNINFNEIPEITAIEKLIKIDLAIKKNNLDYILEVLKCGDNLSTSRALKCPWLYYNEYSHIINPEYLHRNIFPHTSLKTKSKILQAISIHMTNPERAEKFFEYCINIYWPDFTSLPYKFLKLTSEAFILDKIEDEDTQRYLTDYMTKINPENIIFLIKDSFEIAEACIDAKLYKKGSFLIMLRHLYSVDNDKLLDLLEKHISIRSIFSYICYDCVKHTLSKRLSETILTKHKTRVLLNPGPYIKLLDHKSVEKHSSCEDAKVYAVALLPDSCDIFWQIDYCNEYKYILNKIAPDELFDFIKQIFLNKYQDEEFEMDNGFFVRGYCKLMSIDQREEWALRYFEKKEYPFKNLPPFEAYYDWCKHMTFNRAVKEMQKFILWATEDYQRADMFAVLIQSAKTQNDLVKLLQYFTERHINEIKNITVDFVQEVIDLHNVFEFEDKCWNAFNALFHNLDDYNSAIEIHKDQNKYHYRILAFTYYVANNKDIPDTLKMCVDLCDVKFQSFEPFCSKLYKDKRRQLYTYLLNFQKEKILSLDRQLSHDEGKSTLKNHIDFVEDLYQYFKKSETYQISCIDSHPALIAIYTNVDNLLIPKKSESVSEDLLLHYLRIDAILTTSNFSGIECSLEKNKFFKLNRLLKKLKIYFSQDVSLQYLAFFYQLLSKTQVDRRCALAAVHGIIQLCDEKLKYDFITKYIPENTKIDNFTIDRNLLYVQEAICRVAFTSQPPIQHSVLAKYIKEDYVQYCVSMFDSYIYNLPRPLCFEFIELLLDLPVSIRKHGVRLAFKYFDSQNLTKTIPKVWRETKDISLRSKIYHSLILKTYFCEYESLMQIELEELSKTVTMDLHPENDENIINDIVKIFIKKLDEFGDSNKYTEIVWNAIKKFPDEPAFHIWKSQVISHIVENISSFTEKFVREIVDEHVYDMLIEKQITKNDVDLNLTNLWKCKWDLIKRYIFHFINLLEDEIIIQSINKLTNFIVDKCLEIWNAGHENVLGFCLSFIEDVAKDFIGVNVKINFFLDGLLNTLQKNVPLTEMYMFLWRIRLLIVANTVIINTRKKFVKEKLKVIKRETVIEISNHFTNDVCLLINGVFDKRQYLRTFEHEIADEIKNCIETVLKKISNKKNIGKDSVLTEMFVYVASGLIDFPLMETTFLGIRIFKMSNKESKRLAEKISKIEN